MAKKDPALLPIAKRLKKAREQAGLTIKRAAEKADTTFTEWLSWENAKAPIPARNAWLIAVRIYGPVSWLLRGEQYQPPKVPHPFPTLGDDLSGFASRVRQARQALGITLADIRQAENETRLFADTFKLWETGQDEPDYVDALRLADRLEVDLAWLYAGDAGAKPMRAKKPSTKDGHTLAKVSSSGSFGDRMRQAREASGLSHAQAAAIIGPFEYRSIRDLERREHCPLEKETLIAFATLYGVSAEWLVCGDDGLAILRRRIQRLKSRVTARKASAA